MEIAPLAQSPERRASRTKGPLNMAAKAANALHDSMEEINMMLVGKMGTLFVGDENNPLSNLLANVVSNNIPLE